MRLAMHLVDAASYKNEALRELFGIRMSAGHGPAHRAYNDAAVTAAIFLELLARYSRTSHPQSVAGMIEVTRRPALLGRFAFGSYRGEDISTVPTSYLQWILAEGFENWPDVRATAQYELARRDAIAAQLKRAV
jgi:DNA polymerase III epsilon subunit-like protein